jgi:hypothetical protein
MPGENPASQHRGMFTGSCLIRIEKYIVTPLKWIEEEGNLFTTRLQQKTIEHKKTT